MNTSKTKTKAKGKAQAKPLQWGHSKTNPGRFVAYLGNGWSVVVTDIAAGQCAVALRGPRQSLAVFPRYANKRNAKAGAERLVESLRKALL